MSAEAVRYVTTEVRKTETIYCADGVVMIIVAGVMLAILLAFGVVAIVVNWP